MNIKNFKSHNKSSSLFMIYATLNNTWKWNNNLGHINHLVLKELADLKEYYTVI